MFNHADHEYGALEIVGLLLLLLLLLRQTSRQKMDKSLFQQILHLHSIVV